ncbi:MAG: hypothetical protein JWQ23_1717, partial [Herminiimonas sp.]|nr:hypothetical protein [Herminiimonas sp.]
EEAGKSEGIKTEVSTGPVAYVPERHPDVEQELVIIGGGAAAAQVLEEMNRNTAGNYTNICIVADKDGWSPETRGQGFINQQNELIAHYGDTVPEYDTDYADRATFSKTNDAIIAASVDKGATRITSEVVSIKQLDDGKFEVKFAEGTTVCCRRVILASGLGKNTTLFDVGENGKRTSVQGRMSNMQFIDQPKLRQDGSTMDVNTFSVALDRDHQAFTGKKFIIQGSLVPVDVVEKLKEKLGDDAEIVAWLGREPASFLDKHQLQHAPKVNKERFIFAKHGVKVEPGSPSGKGVKVSVEMQEPGKSYIPLPPELSRNANTVSDPRKLQTTILEADYYIYGLGSDQELDGSGGAILGDLLRELKPVYDDNQVISNRPYETVLGLEIPPRGEGAGMMIIGGAATALSGRVAHNYLERAQANIDSAAKMRDLAKADVEAAQSDVDTSRKILARNDLAQADREAAQSKLDTSRNNLEKKRDLWIRTSRAYDSKMQAYAQAAIYFKNKNSQNVFQALDNLQSTQVSSVISSAQLTAIRAAVSGINGMVPEYNVKGEINYSIDNPTQMRIAIMQRYEVTDEQGDMPQEEVEKFIKEVIELRHLRSTDFVKKAAQDVMDREILPLLASAKSIDEKCAALARLKISPDNCEIIRLWVLDDENMNSLPEGFDWKEGLLEDLRVAFENGPLPVHGIPPAVRAGYASRLDDLAAGRTEDVALAKYWLV